MSARRVAPPRRPNAPTPAKSNPRQQGAARATREARGWGRRTTDKHGEYIGETDELAQRARAGEARGRPSAPRASDATVRTADHRGGSRKQRARSISRTIKDDAARGPILKEKNSQRRGGWGFRCDSSLGSPSPSDRGGVGGGGSAPGTNRFAPLPSRTAARRPRPRRGPRRRRRAARRRAPHGGSGEDAGVLSRAEFFQT